MGLFGSILGGAGSLVGGIFGGDSGGGGTGGASNDALVASANASRDAQIAQSNNNLLAAQTQAAVMQLGIEQNSINAQFQTMAWLTERLDAHETSLQIAVENARLHMTEASNDHVEAMRGLANDARELEIRAYEQVRAGGVETSDFLAS